MSYPWRCLCLGLLLQITITLPRLLMTRHFSHIFFTDGLTFMPYFGHTASLLLYKLICFFVKQYLTI